MDIEEAATEVLVNQLEIARQSVQERNQRIEDLQRKIEVLEGMLNRLAAGRHAFPQPQPLPAHKPAPRRWSVR